MRMENEAAMALLRERCNVAEVMAATGLGKWQVMVYRRRLLRDLLRMAL